MVEATCVHHIGVRPSDKTSEKISANRRLLLSRFSVWKKSEGKQRSRMKVAFTPLTFSIPTHLESPSTHNALSGWLKRNGGLTAGKRGVPRALQSIEPCVYSCLHTSPTFFIYLLWNIYGCYERFKIMCLSLSARSFPLARARLLLHKSSGLWTAGLHIRWVGPLYHIFSAWEKISFLVIFYTYTIGVDSK